MLQYRLDLWSIVSSGDPYTPPELMSQCLMGKVSGDPRREDGTTIITSNIIGQFDRMIVTRNGSLIELGEPSAAYAAAFPNAKERLFNIAPECILHGHGDVG